MIATMQFTTALCRRLNCFTLGSAGHYRRCWVPQHGSGRGAAHLPRPAETDAGERLQTFPGGKGADQAVAAARPGGDVKMVVRVGFDAFGDTLIHALGSDGVDTRRVQRDADEPTRAALILVEQAVRI